MILAIFLILVTAGLVIATHEFVDSSMRSNNPEDDEYYIVNVKPQLELVKELTKKEKKP